MDLQALRPILAKKLKPTRFTEMSPTMGAIVGMVVEEKFTDPEIQSLHITADGHVLIEQVGDVGANQYLGFRKDLYRNWNNLLEAADLTDEEKDAANELLRRKVFRWDQIKAN